VSSPQSSVSFSRLYILLVDGDLYNLIDVTVHPDLRPPVFDAPADYKGPDPLKLDHDATYRDIADFYTNYMTAGEILHVYVVCD